MFGWVQQYTAAWSGFQGFSLLSSSSDNDSDKDKSPAVTLHRGGLVPVPSSPRPWVSLKLDWGFEEEALNKELLALRESLDALTDSCDPSSGSGKRKRRRKSSSTAVITKDSSSRAVSDPQSAFITASSNTAALSQVILARKSIVQRASIGRPSGLNQEILAKVSASASASSLPSLSSASPEERRMSTGSNGSSSSSSSSSKTPVHRASVSSSPYVPYGSSPTISIAQLFPDTPIVVPSSPSSSQSSASPSSSPRNSSILAYHAWPEGSVVITSTSQGRGRTGSFQTQRGSSPRKSGQDHDDESNSDGGSSDDQMAPWKPRAGSSSSLLASSSVTSISGHHISTCDCAQCMAGTSPKLVRRGSNLADVVTTLSSSPSAARLTSSSSVPHMKSWPAVLTPTRHSRFANESNASPKDKAAMVIQSAVRSWLLHKAWRGLVADFVESDASLKLRKRWAVMQEIYATEQSYVNGLNTLMDVYIVPLKASLLQSAATSKGGTGPVKGIGGIRADEVAAMAGTAETIRAVNTRFLSALAEKFEGPADDDTPIVPSAVADVFFSFTSWLVLYKSYVANYPDASAVLASARDRHASFSAWLDDRQSRYDVQSLESFLIRPVQRIPRYILLLRELLKYTPEEHIDYEPLEDALDALKVVADTVDLGQKEVEDLAKLAALQARLDTRDIAALDVPSVAGSVRSWVQEGLLDSVTMDDVVTLSPARVVLLSDMVLVCAAKKRGRKLKLAAVLDLAPKPGESPWSVETTGPTIKLSRPQELSFDVGSRLGSLVSDTSSTSSLRPGTGQWARHSSETRRPSLTPSARSSEVMHDINTLKLVWTGSTGTLNGQSDENSLDSWVGNLTRVLSNLGSSTAGLPSV